MLDRARLSHHLRVLHLLLTRLRRRIVDVWLLVLEVSQLLHRLRTVVPVLAFKAPSGRRRGNSLLLTGQISLNLVTNGHEDALNGLWDHLDGIFHILG